jgi:putative endonuclease
MLNKKKTIGNFGEQLAVDFLIKRGYQIVGNNERLGHKELDIVAKLGNKTVFVEVKTRLSFGEVQAEEALTRGQIETIKKAVNTFCRNNKLISGTSRLDFIAININRLSKTARIKHYVDIC